MSILFVPTMPICGKVNMITVANNKKKKDINIDKDSIKKKTNNNNIKK